MKIDGHVISAEILKKLKFQVLKLREKNIIPTLAIILVGSSKSSESYIKQKKLKAEEIGASIKLFRFDSVLKKDLLSLIEELNNDRLIHGIIVQRPLPGSIDRNTISNSIDPKKDVDGFGSGSNFDPPVGLAVLEILKSIGETDLSSKKIAVIGKGETAGGPIIKLLKKHKIEPQIIDIQTKNPDQIIKSADIIISAVGRENVIKPELLNINQILIGVGLFSKDGKLKGDYDEGGVEEKVKYLTPTLGGVGPVNVSFLMKNLVKSASPQNL